MHGTTPLTAAAFYSGAGGLDLGFEQADYDVLLANDIDPVAIDTHKRINHARVAVAQDVHTLDLFELLPSRPTVVTGGPPCQGFSAIGLLDPNDPRSEHVSTFMSLVGQIQPTAFVMENVKNLYSNPRWAALRDELRAEAARLGYSTNLMLLNAADFGVAQNRQRMFLIGVKGSAPVPLLEPDPAVKPVTVREALQALPRYGEPGNDTFCTAKVTAATKPILRPSPYRGTMMFNGSGRPLDLDRASNTLPASMGGNHTPIIEQNLLDGDTDSWVRWYHGHLLGGGAPLVGQPVSPHLRRLTVEEATVLQGFPVGTRFSGGVSAQFRQIGNSVAPPVGKAVAEHVAMILAAR